MSCNAWKEYTIEELCSVIDSLHKSPKYVEYGYPIIRVKDMNEGFLKFENPAFVTNINLKKVICCLVELEVMV